MTITRRRIIVISILAGIGFQFVPYLAAPGLFSAALLFQQGVHSDFPDLYLGLAAAINFCLFGGASYWLLTRISFGNVRVGGKRSTLEPTPDPTSDQMSRLPVKGTIYTESEIEEFKRRGLM